MEKENRWMPIGRQNTIYNKHYGRLIDVETTLWSKGCKSIVIDT